MVQKEKVSGYRNKGKIKLSQEIHDETISKQSGLIVIGGLHSIAKKIKSKKDYFDQRDYVYSLEDLGYTVNGGNTYNSPDSSLYDTWETATIQKKGKELYDEGIFVAWKHEGGDVRGNYSDKPIIVVSDSLADDLGSFEPDPSYLVQIENAIYDKDLEKFKKAFEERNGSFGDVEYIFGKDFSSWEPIKKTFSDYAKKTVGKSLDLFRVNMDWGLYVEQFLNERSISTQPSEAILVGHTIPIYLR